jgi:hypothetical protein
MRGTKVAGDPPWQGRRQWSVPVTRPVLAAGAWEAGILVPADAGDLPAARMHCRYRASINQGAPRPYYFARLVRVSWALPGVASGRDEKRDDEDHQQSYCAQDESLQFEAPLLSHRSPKAASVSRRLDMVSRRRDSRYRAGPQSPFFRNGQAPKRTSFCSWAS